MKKVGIEDYAALMDRLAASIRETAEKQAQAIEAIAKGFRELDEEEADRDQIRS